MPVVSRAAAIVIVSALTLAVDAQTPALRDRMLAVEDARVTLAADLAPLLQGLRSTDPRIVIQAVRALGRFERPQLVTELLPLVTHARPDVRAEVLNALGQSLAAIPRMPDQPSPLPIEVTTVTKTLLARLRIEPDPYVTGIAAETFGRLPFRTAASLKEADDALVALLPGSELGTTARLQSEPIGRVVRPQSVSGAVKGLETRIRVYQKLEAPGPIVIARLRSAAALGSDPSDADLAYIRRVAWTALNSARGADAALVERGLDDPDAQVRRLAILALGNIEGAGAAIPRLLGKALKDTSFIVRYDAVRTYSKLLQPKDCAPLVAAVDDKQAHVALAAIDALGNGCPAGPNPTPLLVKLSDAVGTARPQPGAPGNWHRAAHAFVSLSRVAREQATSRLPALAEHPVWQVRMYAARAAREMMASGRLERLANDDNDNVREAAIEGLLAVRQHDADNVYISALNRRDYQLVRTAANALKGSRRKDAAVQALLKAFARITSEGRDTSRDPRMAILATVRDLGGKANAPALTSCLSDFDPEVAQQCADTLRAWTGTAQTPHPVKRAAAAVAPPATRRVRITMQRGGPFEIRLFPDEAAATVTRFVRLARQGHYNGLTFHRVVPNFVIQGGSPGANEYMGDGPFMRDEVGLRTHGRGTLGISTRGRDTGDAQIFVNLVDNPRLDHNFTVFGEVTTGMDVVDGILEGDVIERIDVLESVAGQRDR
jgi:cyclophilin family peptidyl-prolyl cis-trans isomerase/HEAT repeat protein